MTQQHTGWTGGQRAFGDVAPGLVHYADKILFDEVWEAITHLAFYAGWPEAMSAMTIAKEVFLSEESTE